MAQFSDQDYILISSYIDGQLEASERAAFEARLAADFALRAELDALRETVGLLKMADRVPVPHNFTLNPATYGRPARKTLWDTLGLSAMPGWAIAGGSLVIVALCLGAAIVRGGLGGAATTVAQAPQALSASGAAAPEVATEAATEASAMDTAMFAAEATEAPQPFAPALSTSAKSSDVTPSGMGGMAGGGPGDASSGSAEGGATGSSGVSGGDGTLAAPPDEGTTSPFVQSLPFDATQGTEDSQDNYNADQAGASVRNAGPSPSPLPYGTIEVVEAQPWDNLEPVGWAILLGGTVLLVAAVLVATALMRRRK